MDTGGNSLTGAEEVPAGGDACVYPQTVRLREDMKVCVKGRGPGRDGAVEVGYWYQRYLPSTNTTLPPQAQLSPGQEPSACAALQTQIDSLRSEQRALTEAKVGLDPRDLGDRLDIARINQEIADIAARIAPLEQQRAVIGCSPYTPGERPTQGYTHPWKFLAEPVFKLADRFSHFGVYDSVDSRSQYYLVSDADAALLGRGSGWRWIDDSGQLAIDAYLFRFDRLRLPWLPERCRPIRAPRRNHRCSILMCACAS